jgi:hypothetical protein
MALALLTHSALACALALPLAAQGAPARVALVLDQDSPRYRPLFTAFRREIEGFFRPGEIDLLASVAAHYGTPQSQWS